MNALLAQFIEETRDLLETIASGLLRVEQDPLNADLLNEVFRSAHTIKGSSGLFEILPITRAVHAAEDLLDALRNGTLHYLPDMGDILLDTFDHVSHCIDRIERQEGNCELGPELDLAAENHARALRAFLEALAADQPVPSADEDPSGHVHAPMDHERFLSVHPLLEQLSEQQLLEAWELCLQGKPPILVDYRPDEQCYFTGEDPVHQLRQMDLLYAVYGKRKPADQEYDPYLCRFEFLALSQASQEELVELFRYYLDHTTIQPLPAEWLILPRGDRNDGPVYEDFVDRALELVHEGKLPTLEQECRTLLDITSEALWVASALRWLARLAVAPLNHIMDQQRHTLLMTLLESMRHQTVPGWGQSQQPAQQPPADGEPPAQLPAPPPEPERETAEKAIALKVLQGQLHALRTPGSADSLEGRLNTLSHGLRNSLVYLKYDQDVLDAFDAVVRESREQADTAPLLAYTDRLLHQNQQVETTAEIPPPQPPLPPQPAASQPAAQAQPASIPAPPMEKEKGQEPETGVQQSRQIKVDQIKLDTLMNLIGEIVVAKNALPYLAQRAEDIYGTRELSRELKDYYAVINRISQDMQTAIMQVRMLPVSNVFQRFRRLVRDLSRKLNKQIELTIEGEDTEADKNIVELLADPMIHILRNSIDHGIEMPEERLDQGKPAFGTIHVRAWQENDHVSIAVSDDGKGIDPAVMRRKAQERGLISAEEADTMSDQAAVNLVFAPGFSTASQVSDLSGRGVGMDVVRSTIEAAGGSVNLQSVKGQGTEILLTLPLSMAVTYVMAVEIGGQRYGVSMSHVVETVRLRKDETFFIKQEQVFMLRDRLVPIRNMRVLFGEQNLHDVENGSAELSILVVRVGNDLVGMMVDRFHEGVEIILKPMEGVLSQLSIYSGSALLGDGSVLLVLDLKELLS